MVTEVLLNSPQVTRAIETLANEIFEDLGPTFNVIGVATGGVKVSEMLLAAFATKHNYSPQFGTIDITLYRDDLYTGLERPALGVTDIPFQVNSKPILLVDDVIFTGRTIRAALQELGDLGRPKLVRLAVLLDRRHREVPIHPDYWGLIATTQRQDRIEVAMDGQNNCVVTHSFSPQVES